MRFSIVSALAMASTVAAHTTVWSVWVNGKDQGDGRAKYIRSPESNSPVKDLTSKDLACNTKGGTPVADFVSAAAGDKIQYEWYHDNRGDDIIASSHKGPIITYIAKYTEDDGTGGIWSKIAEEGYDGSAWAVDKLIGAKGKANFTIPEKLAAGKYLIRQEIIALHESDAAYNVNPARGAQFYPSCVQFEITGTGSAEPTEDFDFNKGYTYSDPDILFNLYGSFTSYEIPGPAVWDGTGSGSGGYATTKTAAASATGTAGNNDDAPVATASSTAPAYNAPEETKPAYTAPEETTPTPTFSTVFTSAAGAVPTSAEPAVPTTTKKPKTGCSARRRRRRSAHNKESL